MFEGLPLKECGACSSTDFDRWGRCRPCRAAYMRDWNAKNPEKVKAQNRKYKIENPEKYRDSQLRSLFGITAQDYDDMFRRQGGCCMVCGSHQSELKRRLAVDHCHKTDEVRGLLCGNCNTALGLVGDSIETLMSLIDYLRRTSR